MYKITDTVAKTLNDNGTIQNITIKFKSGNTSYTLTGADIRQGSFQYDAQLFSGENIELGAMVASQIQFTLINRDRKWDSVTFEGAELYVTLGVADSTIPIGYYIVTEKTRTIGSVTVTALDRMVKFDQPCNLTGTYTVKNLINKLCSDSGVIIDNDIADYPNVNTSVTITEKNNEQLSYRTLAQSCLMLLGCNGWMTRTGTLHIGWSTPNTGVIVQSSNRFSHDLSESNVTVSGVAYTEDKTTHYAGTLNYAIDISDCRLSFANIDTVVANIYASVKNYSYRPMNCVVKPAPYLDLGDEVTYVDDDGQKATSLITNISYGVNSHTTIQSVGMTSQEASYSQYNLSSIASKIIQTAEERATVIADERATITEHMNEVLANGMGLYQFTVTDSNGATKYYWGNAKTLAGSNIIYTFNDGGFAWTDNWNNGNPKWNYGVSSDGNMVVNTIKATNINANQITAGTIKDTTGNNYWNLDTGEIKISSISDTVDSAVKSVTYYYLQNYGAVPEKTDSAWSTTAPAWVDGMHVWQMVETEYISGKKVKSAPVDITGNTGATGSTGATGDSGRGIVSQKIEYTLSTSPYQIIDQQSVIGTSKQIVFGVVGTYKGVNGGSYPLYLSKPNSACGVWVSEQPAVSDGYYLWSKTTSNYSDGTSDYILRSESNLTEIKKQSDENAKNYNSLSTNVDSLETRVASNEDVISHVTMWNKFNADGLTIGKDGSANKININEKQITFYNGDDQVAYVNNNWLYITNGNFTNTLQIGKFAFVPRANGSLDFKKVG